MVIQFQGLLPAPTSLIYLFFLRSPSFPQEQKGKKSKHFCEEFPGTQGAAAGLIRSPLGIAAQICRAQNNVHFRGKFLSVECKFLFGLENSMEDDDGFTDTPTPPPLGAGCGHGVKCVNVKSWRRSQR